MEKFLQARTKKKAVEKKIKNFPLKDGGAEHAAPEKKKQNPTNPKGPKHGYLQSRNA